MDESRADAIVQALLQPDDAARKEQHRKRMAQARREADARLAAWSAMPGFALGAAVAYMTGNRIALGIIWGGILGAWAGRMIGVWRGRPRAAA